jgi:signal transduction histidine kinase
MRTLPSSESTDTAVCNPARLAAVARSGLVDTGRDEAFDAITRLCCGLLGTPISLVTLIDAQRQFFKSAIGLPEPWASRRETPLSHSFCQHVLGHGRAVIIDDARADRRTASHPAVTELGVVAYAGVPLLVDGQPIGAFCAADGGPRRWTERELGALADLASLVVVQIERDLARAELQQAVDHLARADRRKDEFIATIAHELRNPVTPIVNSAHVLRRLDLGHPTATRLAGTIDRQARIMGRLIEDLMDVNRATRDVLELDRHRVPLDEVIDAALETVLPRLEARGLSFSQQRADRRVWIDADPVRLSQVLVNLLGNAVKFTPSGGRVALEAAVRGETIELRVRDTGIGLSADSLERIFEMFAQTGEAPGLAPSGLGIGLSLARRLVELHGGSLTAASEGLGKGSVFTVTLPQRQRDAQA